MKCVMLMEYSNPKDDARWNKIVAQSKDLEKLLERLVKEGSISPDANMWADNTGRVFYWLPFESMEQFAKMYSDEELQKVLAGSSRLIDDVRICLLRPGIEFDD